MLVENPLYWDITYKEVMRLWNISANAASLRLWRIRKRLKKRKYQKITVAQFCEDQDISLQEFNNMLKPVVTQTKLF